MLKTKLRNFLTSIIPLKQPPTQASQFFHEEKLLKPTNKATPDPKNDDVLLIKRIIKFYQQASKNEEKRGNSMWQEFFEKRHIPIHEVFKTGDFDRAADILRDPSSTELLWGIDNLTIEIQPAIIKNAYNHALLCLDCLVRLGEAMGAIGYYHPEDPWTAEIIIDKIEKHLGKKITFPNPFPHEHGLLTPRGVASYRAPQALYQAWCIKQLLKDFNHPKVLEIGAGLGRTACFAQQLGIEDYTIVDLPFTALGSGYFLGCALGPNRVLLSGETSAQSEKCVKFMTPNEYFSSVEKYDLILNVDSLTEMDPYVAQKYWKKIESNRGLFLSINHENNPFTVKSFIEKSSLIDQYDRKPYWMRKNYFEELVRFKSFIQRK